MYMYREYLQGFKKFCSDTHGFGGSWVGMLVRMGDMSVLIVGL